MSSERTELDRLIDEALRDLTAGAPREGFRGRVMARIAASPEPARVRLIETRGWRMRPIWVAAAAVVTSVLAAAIVVPPLLRSERPASPEIATARRSPALSSKVPAAQQAAGSDAAVPVQAASAPAPSRPRRTAVRSAADAIETPAVEEYPSSVNWVTVDPLPDPDPIVHSAIEITPVEIQPLVIPEIQVPSLEAGGPVRSPGSARQ